MGWSSREVDRRRVERKSKSKRDTPVDAQIPYTLGDTLEGNPVVASEGGGARGCGKRDKERRAGSQGTRENENFIRERFLSLARSPRSLSTFYSLGSSDVLQLRAHSPPPLSSGRSLLYCTVISSLSRSCFDSPSAVIQQFLRKASSFSKPNVHDSDCFSLI